MALALYGALSWSHVPFGPDSWCLWTTSELPNPGCSSLVPAGCLVQGGVHGMRSPSAGGGSQKRLHHEWSLLSALIMTDPLGFACWERDCCLTFMWGRAVSLGWRPAEQVWWMLRQGLRRPRRALESGLAGHLGAQGPELSSACFPLLLVHFLGWRYITLPWDHRYLPQSMFMGFFTSMNFTWER